MSIYRRVLRYYRPFLGQTILGLFLSLIGIGLNLLKPWPFKIIVDNFLRAGSAIPSNWRIWVPLLCLALVVIQFLWGIINWITNYLFVKTGLQALLKLRTDLYSYLQSLSLKYHDARRSSDSSFRVAYDSQSIQTIYNKGFTNIFGSIITLIGTFVIMLRLDWQLTLVSLAIVPLIVGQLFLRPYLYAEHTGCDRTRSAFQNTRTTYTGMVTRWFAWNMPYHVEHHAYPSIPFHALPKLNAIVDERIVFRGRGYLAVTRET